MMRPVEQKNNLQAPKRYHNCKYLKDMYYLIQVRKKDTEKTFCRAYIIEQMCLFQRNRETEYVAT